MRAVPERNRRDPEDAGARPPLRLAFGSLWHGAARRQSGDPGQGSEHGAEVSEILRRCFDAEQATVFLHHINAGATVWGIDHHAHRPAWLQNASKGAKALVRVGQVMQDARANYQVESALNLTDPLDGESMQLDVVQLMFALEIARMVEARLADVDRNDAGVWFAKRYLAACEVPQPATRISRPAEGRPVGQARWKCARRRIGFL